uniref:Uncharacterized protein n=1 Tax=Meloidogyne hapla TaxID=6305 RepID=A0A1I8BUY3_MELHA
MSIKVSIYSFLTICFLFNEFIGVEPYDAYKTCCKAKSKCDQPSHYIYTRERKKFKCDMGSNCINVD